MKQNIVTVHIKKGLKIAETCVSTIKSKDIIYVKPSVCGSEANRRGNLVIPYLNCWMILMGSALCYVSVISFNSLTII